MSLLRTALFTVAIVALDALTKLWAVQGGFGLESTRWLFTDAAGIGFGAHLNTTALLGTATTGIALGVAGIIAGGWLALRAGSVARRVAGCLLLAGALGNTADRLLYGGVVDWIGPAWVGAVNVPVVANVADVALLGAFGLVLLVRRRP